MDNLLASLRSNGIGHDVFEDSLATLLNNYKEDVKVNYIFAAPTSDGFSAGDVNGIMGAGRGSLAGVFNSRQPLAETCLLYTSRCV